MKLQLFSILLLLFINLCHKANSQNSDIWFDFIDATDGLSSNNIIDIIQDSQGLMWFVTDKGLNIYDAHSIENFHRLERQGFPRKINCIKEIKKNDIFLGSDNGLCIFNSSTYKFKFLNKRNFDFYSNVINTVYKSDDKSIWLGTEKGITKLNNKYNSAKSYIPDGANTEEISITDISDGNTNNLWIGTKDGLFSFNKRTNKFFKIKLLQNSFDKEVVSGIINNQKGDVIVTLKNGYILRYNNIQKSFELVKRFNNTITSICEGEGNTIYIGTNNGILKFNYKNHKLERYTTNTSLRNISLNNENISNLYKDKDNIIWIATEQGGVNILDIRRKKFKKYSIKNMNPYSEPFYIRSLYEDEKQQLWVGTQGGGLYKYTSLNSKPIQFLADSVNIHDNNRNNIRVIFPISKNRFLIGSYGKGLYLFTQNEYKPIELKYRTPKQRINEVYCIVKKNDSTLLIGTNIGLAITNIKNYKTKIIQPIPKDFNANSNRVNYVFIDSHNKIWIATKSAGLLQFDYIKNKFIPHNLVDRDAIESKNIICVYEDYKNDLWIGTYDKGLIKYNPYKEEIIYFNKINKRLPDNTVYGILKESPQSIWFSTNQGLIRFNINDYSFFSFDKEEGLQENEFNRGAFFKGSSGLMYFGGIKGFNIFNPNEVIKLINRKPPLIALRKLEVNDKFVMFPSNILPQHINNIDTLILDENIQSFKISFSALNYLFPDKNKYQYRMLGLLKK